MLHQRDLSSRTPATYTDIFICASALYDWRRQFPGTTCSSREFPAIISPFGQPSTDARSTDECSPASLRAVGSVRFLDSDPFRLRLTLGYCAAGRQL